MPQVVALLQLRKALAGVLVMVLQGHRTWREREEGKEGWRKRGREGGRERKRERERDEGIHYRDFLMHFWRLRSPRICGMQVRKVSDIIQSESKGLRTGSLMSMGRRKWMSQTKQREQTCPLFWLFAL